MQITFNYGGLTMELQLHQLHAKSDFSQCIVVCNPINYGQKKTLGSPSSKNNITRLKGKTVS